MTRLSFGILPSQIRTLHRRHITLDVTKSFLIFRCTHRAHAPYLSACDGKTMPFVSFGIQIEAKVHYIEISWPILVEVEFDILLVIK
jgi:hypothetical protein